MPATRSTTSLATRLVQGRTLLSKCLHDISVALDYLATRPEVDPQRIGFIGHSYGGRMAIWAPAIDDRILASVSNCGCVNYKQSFTHDTGVQMEFCLPGRPPTGGRGRHPQACGSPRVTSASDCG